MKPGVRQRPVRTNGRRVRQERRFGEDTARGIGARRPVERVGLSAWLLPALASGLLLGVAYPPVGASWTVWVGLVPLLWAIRRERRPWRAFVTGAIAGTVMCLFVLRPAVSAHVWSGWITGDAATVASLRSRQFVVLNVLWPILAVIGGSFWGVFAVMLLWIARGSLGRLALAAPALVVLVAEWLRSLIAWDFQWAFLGNAAIDIRGVRQLGALGGVWLLSWLVATVNVAILALLSREKGRERWMLPAVTAAVVVLILSGGAWRAGAIRTRLAQSEGLRAAALQFRQEARYTFSDFTPVGFETAYVQLMGEVARGKAGNVQLLVLPESISYTVMSLDGSRTAAKPASVHRSPQQWMETLAPSIGESDARFMVILGLDTVERGVLHNSLGFWTKSGLQGWYHKQRLVPLAEYRPALLGLFGMRGPTEYEPGDASRVVTMNGVRFGGFICQEVLTPWITRRSTRDGAQVLVSGGNDGVFASPAVAQVNAAAARLRAVETGRYIIRAMKTGVSAIIDPTGEEIARSKSAEPALLAERIIPLDELTPYVRFGDWPVALAAAVVLAVGLISLRDERLLRREAVPHPARPVDRARSA